MVGGWICVRGELCMRARKCFWVGNEWGTTLVGCASGEGHTCQRGGTMLGKGQMLNVMIGEIDIVDCDQAADAQRHCLALIRLIVFSCHP